MKEKIGIEKLIELLNEYDNREKYGIKRKIGTDPIGIYGYFNGYGLGFTSKARIISKEYGFIKWLVENDKIDFDNRDLKDRFMNEFERYPQFQNNTTNREFNINGLLMLLSISDTPIEDLISYLK